MPAPSGSRVGRSCSRRVGPAACTGRVPTPRSPPATVWRSRVRAGALLTDMEFVQFHPTAFAREGAPRFLITEALRGEGAVLRTEHGCGSCSAGWRRASWRRATWSAARFRRTRPVPARRVSSSTQRRSRATASSLDSLRYADSSRRMGLDPSRDPIPVSPAAHYTIGGSRRTSRPERPCRTCWPAAKSPRPESTGRTDWPATPSWKVSSLGSGRCASSSTRHRRTDRTGASRSHAGRCRRRPRRLRSGPDNGPGHPLGGGRDRPNPAGLSAASRDLGRLDRQSEPREGQPAGAGANAALTARIIALAALTREESRGPAQSDYPRPRAAWRRTLGVIRAPRAVRTGR